MKETVEEKYSTCVMTIKLSSHRYSTYTQSFP